MAAGRAPSWMACCSPGAAPPVTPSDGSSPGASSSRGGVRWLFWRGGRTDEPTARIDIGVEGAPQREVTLRLSPDVSTALVEKLVAKGEREPFVQIETTLASGGAKLTATTAVSYDNVYVFTQDGPRELKVSTVRLVESTTRGHPCPSLEVLLGRGRRGAPGRGRGNRPRGRPRAQSSPDPQR